MNINLSEALKEKMFGDEAVIRHLKSCEDAFSAGNRTALYEAIALCARFQAVIPEWAADVILEGEKALKSGECKDFNEFFCGAGNRFESQRARRREERIKANVGNVIGQLTKYRCEGGSLNAEEAFGHVSEITGLPRRDVEEIYRRHGTRIKDIPPGNPGGVSYCSAHGILDLPRRSGRPIL